MHLVRSVANEPYEAVTEARSWMCDLYRIATRIAVSAFALAFLALFPVTSYAITFDCSHIRTIEDQFERSDLVVVAQVAPNGVLEGDSGYMLDAYRLWKGDDTSFQYVSNGFDHRGFELGEFYLLFLSYLPAEKSHTRDVCHYGDLVTYSGEILLALGDPTWRYGHD